MEVSLVNKLDKKKQITKKNKQPIKNYNNSRQKEKRIFKTSKQEKQRVFHSKY